MQNSGMVDKRMKKAPIKEKNESNSSLFCEFFNAEWCFLQLFNTYHKLTRAMSYAKVSIILIQ